MHLVVRTRKYSLLLDNVYYICTNTKLQCFRIVKNTHPCDAQTFICLSAKSFVAFYLSIAD